MKNRPTSFAGRLRYTKISFSGMGFIPCQWFEPFGFQWMRHQFINDVSHRPFLIPGKDNYLYAHTVFEFIPIFGRDMNAVIFNSGLELHSFHKTHLLQIYNALLRYSFPECVEIRFEFFRVYFCVFGARQDALEMLFQFSPLDEILAQ
jgi:hypothetical protein